MKIVMTGGHHSSALPIIQELKTKYPQTQVIWLGHKYSMLGDKNPTLEYRQINDLGIPFLDLHAGKVYKTFNLWRLIKLPLGFFQALFYLIKSRPDVILSFGGYLAVPVVVMGWFLGIPSFTHEQTIVAGYANKVISKFATKIFVSWQGSQKYFSNSKKVIYAGIPLRQSIFKVTSNNFTFNNNLPTIYVTGGKTGSHKINIAIQNALQKLLQNFNVIHQCGDHSEFKDHDHLSKLYFDISKNGDASGKYYLRKFVLDDEIGEVFKKSILVVSRSGAHIIRELLVLEKPALLIPIPWVSHNEQMENARYLKNAGLAKILEEASLNGDSLFDELLSMIGNINGYKLNESYKIPNVNSADIIIKEIMSLT